MVSPKFDTFWESLKKEFPDAEIIHKDASILMLFIDIILRIITFNRFKTFRTRYITTIGNKMYVPLNWDERSNLSKIIVTRHERVHMRQSRDYGRITFSLLYLFCLPAVFTFRAKFEREAYEESIRAYGDLGGVELLKTINRKSYVKNFTGPNYFYMWPFKKSIESWFDKTVAEVRDEILKK